jgi:ribosomal protein S13
MTIVVSERANGAERVTWREPCPDCQIRRRHATRVGRITNQVVNDVMSTIRQFTDQTWTIEKDLRRAVAEGVERAVKLTARDPR